MPIMNLSDVNQVPELMIIGKLFKGESKTKSPNRPTDLEYFRFETPYPALAQRFQSVYGTQPQAVRVLLPYDDYITPAGEKIPALYRIFDSWMKDYTGGKLQTQCTGERIVRQLINGRLQEVDEPCQCRATNSWKCKARGTLYMFIPELLPSADFEAGMIGIVSLTTGSIFDNGKLARQISQILAIIRAHGKHLQEVPLVLSRRIESVPVPQSSKRQDKWLCNIAFDPGTPLSSAYALGGSSVPAISAMPDSADDETLLMLPEGESEPEEETPLPPISPVDVFKTAPPAPKAAPLPRSPSTASINVPMLPGDPVVFDPTPPTYQINDQALAKTFFDKIREAYPHEKMTDMYVLSQLLEMKAPALTPDNIDDTVKLMTNTLYGAYATIQKLTNNFFSHENQLWNSITKAGVWGEKNWPKPGDVSGWDIFITYGTERGNRDSASTVPQANSTQDPLFPEEETKKAQAPQYW